MSPDNQLIAYVIVGSLNAYAFLFSSNQCVRLLNFLSFTGMMTMITIIGLGG